MSVTKITPIHRHHIPISIVSYNYLNAINFEIFLQKRDSFFFSIRLIRVEFSAFVCIVFSSQYFIFK